MLQSWPDGVDPDQRKVGLILLIENADIIREPAEVGFWYEQGVRMVGPAWHSNRFTFSDRDPGPLTDVGRELLDLTHMADAAAREALARGYSRAQADAIIGGNWIRFFRTHLPR